MDDLCLDGIQFKFKYIAFTWDYTALQCNDLLIYLHLIDTPDCIHLNLTLL